MPAKAGIHSFFSVETTIWIPGQARNDFGKGCFATLPTKVKILHKYVLSEFFPSFAVGLLLFTLVLILNYLFWMMDLFLNRGIGIGVILKIASLVLPMFLPLSLPMASLLATLSAYGRLSEDGELTALRSAGCSLFQYGIPTILFGGFLSLLLLFFNVFVIPRVHQQFKNMYYSVIQKNPIALFVPKVLNHFGEYHVIVDKMDSEKKKLMGVGVYKTNPEGAPTRILAPMGLLNTDSTGALMMELRDGAIHQPDPKKGNEYTITKFNRLTIRIAMDEEKVEKKVTPREMTWTQLQDKIISSIQNHQSPAPWKTENDLRIAIAFAPLFFVLLGVGLGLKFKKGGKAVGVGMSLIVILLYYGVLVLTVSLSSQGIFPSILLTWIPNTLAGFGGAYLIWQVAQE